MRCVAAGRQAHGRHRDALRRDQQDRGLQVRHRVRRQPLRGEHGENIWKPSENIYNMLHFSQRTCRKLNNWFRTARTMAL